MLSEPEDGDRARTSYVWAGATGTDTHTGAVQYKGYGRRLMQEAEKIATEQAIKIAVISGSAFAPIMNSAIVYRGPTWSSPKRNMLFLCF